MRRCPSPSRCCVAARPPAKFVEPTLVTSVCGRFSGSITTSGNCARERAASCPVVSSLVTAISARRPVAARSRAHVPARSALVRMLTTIATSSSAPASTAPWTISVEYALRSVSNSTSIVSSTAVSPRRCGSAT